MSKAWSVVETKARLSEVLKKATRMPQIIENRGTPVAVILSIDEYHALIQRAGDTATLTSMQRLLQASELLRRDGDSTDLALPQRGDREGLRLTEDEP